LRLTTFPQQHLGGGDKDTKIDRKIIAAVGIAVVVTALATGLFLTYGPHSIPGITTQSVHAQSAATCTVEFTGSAGVLENCTFADGSSVDCVYASGLYCKPA